MNQLFDRSWRAAPVAALVIACAAAQASVAPGAPQSSANVELAFRDPAGIVARDSAWTDRDQWLDKLGRYVVEHASAHVPEGARLRVTITGVQRAGMVEPWLGRGLWDVRIVRDSTPPRIDLTFQLVSPQGAVLKEGTRTLRDMNFLRRTGIHSGEPLSYEKNLIDDWLRQDFGPAPR